MTSLNSLLLIGNSALSATQTAISVTSNNIANVNTEGYSRQVVSLSTTDPIETSFGLVGTGVEVSDIERVYDKFVNNQILSANQELGEFEAEAGILGIVETVFDETDGNGLSELLNDFWNSWQDLSNDPSGYAERTALAAAAENLAAAFNDMASSLSEIQQDIDLNIEATVEDINSIAEQIAALNLKISQAEEKGISANEYEDSRDQLISSLSSLIDINVSEDDSGMVSISVGGGNVLVEGSSAYSLGVESNVATGLFDIIYTDSGGSASIITEDISGGKLAGWLTARDVDIPEYLDGLNSLASDIITQVNALHSTGYDLNGSTGAEFFSGSSAADIALNTDISDDVNLIAASQSSTGADGNNENAIAIANLQNEDLMNGGTATFGDFYSTLVSQVGSDVETAQTNLEAQTDTVEALENYRESISGVSLDEEMVKLVAYQSAYEAAAKVISIAEELMDTVINMV